MATKMNMAMLEAVREFFEDDDIDEEWLSDHVTVEFEEHSKTVTIRIWDMCDQEYGWIKEGYK